MALTSSTDLNIGSACPSFTLVSVDGKTYSLSDFSGSKALLIAFICNHCPYVKAIEDELLALRDIDDLQIIGICSNDPTKYPEDSPEALLKHWREKQYGFPYLLDTTQEVAKAFDAVCTPDLYVYDANRKLYYHGRFQELGQAVRDLIAGKAPPVTQTPSMGCSIKWFSK
jgi:peroxiredoxin